MIRIKGFRVFDLGSVDKLPSLGELFRVGPFVGRCLCVIGTYVLMCVVVDNRY